jgi:hypothetical protein
MEKLNIDIIFEYKCFAQLFTNLFNSNNLHAIIWYIKDNTPDNYYKEGLQRFSSEMTETHLKTLECWEYWMPSEIFCFTIFYVYFLWIIAYNSIARKVRNSLLLRGEILWN